MEWPLGPARTPPGPSTVSGAPRRAVTGTGRTGRSVRACSPGPRSRRAGLRDGAAAPVSSVTSLNFRLESSVEP
eukprot:676321-Hanusia_phi.AAC.1